MFPPLKNGGHLPPAFLNGFQFCLFILGQLQLFNLLCCGGVLLFQIDNFICVPADKVTHR
ncbi:hypothetical protein EMIT0P294_150093 [Pseudomonas sp. IT-P294]